jgi:hypothetical protein
MTGLVLVLLAQVQLYDEGSQLGSVTRINCSGSGITCTKSGTSGTLSVSGGGLGGGAPTDVGYWTSSSSVDLSAEKNLGALGTGLVLNTSGTPSAYAGTSCTNQFPRSLNASGAATCASVSLSADVTGSLPGGSVSGAVATATALAADPADCSAGQYATTIAASGALTCAQVATSQLSGTITNAQLASTYSGVGVCGANTWASTLSTNAAPTCTQPGFSNLSGTATDAQIPDNITVTLAGTATALAADPADCASNRYATSINASGTLTCAQVDLSAGVTGTLPSANGGATATARITAANATNSTVTPATTGLSWSVAASTAYGFFCVVTSTGTATSLARFNLNGPASSTVSFTTERYLTTSTQTLLVLQAFSATAQTAACTASCATTQLPTLIFGTILTGASSGTVDLQFASSTAAQSVTVHRGSYCRVY